MMKYWIKNILLGWLSLVASFAALGQELDQAEYFINQDPGPGNGTAISITNGTTLDESFTINTAGLNVGNHTLYLRTKEANGRWSLDRELFFYVQDTVKDVAFIEEREIVAAEYFVDTDPGSGLGISVPVTTGDEVSASFTLDTDGLSTGTHTVYLRTRDHTGIWGIARQMNLFIQDTVIVTPPVDNRFIVAAEYFIDEDPGVNNGSVIPVTVEGETSDSFSVATAGLANGAHKLYVRTQDNSGLWSISKGIDIAVIPSDQKFPLPFFTADTVSRNETMTFMNLSDSVDENTTYEWDIFDDGELDFTTESIAFDFDTTGLIPVRLTASNGEDSNSYLGKVLIGDFGNRTLTASASTDLCEGDEIILSAPDGYDFYAWNTGDSTQNLAVSTQGIYFAWLTDQNGFTIKSELLEVLVTPSIIAAIETFPTSTGMSNGFAQVSSMDLDLQYDWSTGAVGISYLGDLGAGSYHVVLAKGECSTTLPFTIEEVTPEVSDIVGAEYFFDMDPGPGAGTSFNVSSGQDVTYAQAIPTDGLTPGNHILHVRTLDREGLWSLTGEMEVFIQDTETVNPTPEERLIVAAEYYFDTDPGVGNGMEISVSEETASISESLNIETGTLNSGQHTLYLRTQSDDGLWSQSESLEFRNCDTAVDIPMTEDVLSCPGDNVILSATGIEGNTYLWFYGDSTLIENQVSETFTAGRIEQDTVFYVAQVDVTGCQSPLAQINVRAPQLEVFAGLDQTISQAGETFELKSFFPAAGEWSGPSISPEGIITRTAIGVSNHIYTYSVDTEECTFSDDLTVSVLDLSETFNISIDENQPINTVLQQIINEDVLSYELVSGDEGIISIENDGRVLIADSAYFDFEANQFPRWVIWANQTEEFTYSSILNVSVVDVPEAPSIADQSFNITENMPLGTIIGSIVAEDQDTPTLVYSIDSGNEDGVFSMVNDNQLAIADSAAFDFETNSSFELVVSVDDGTTSVSASIEVSVDNISELPIVSGEPEVIACQDDEIIFMADGTDLLWFSDASLTTEVATGSEFSPATTEVGTFTFYVAEKVNETVGEAVELTLTVNQVYNEVASESIPLGEEYIFGSQTLTEDGMYTELFQSVAGCDSTVVLTLNVIPPGPSSDGNTIALNEDETLSFNEASFNYDSGSDSEFTRLRIESLPSQGILTYDDTEVTASQEITVADLGTSRLVYAPADDFNGADAFNYSVGDATEYSSESAAMNLTITAINDAPAFTLNGDITVPSNFTTTETVTVTPGTVPDDESSQTVTYSLEPTSVDFAAVSFDAETGTVTITSIADASGIQNFIITANDQQAVNNEFSDSFTLTVSTGNIAPEIEDQTFEIAENSANASIVGTVQASDVNGDAFTFSITDGNSNNAFAIDSNSGSLSVDNSSALDFETTPSFSLTVSVSDGELSSTGIITVNLSDVDEGGNNAPSIEDQTFSIDENSSVSTAIGTIVANDTDGDALTFSITGGNTDDAFAVDGSSGALTVANSSPLDFETTPSFSLTVEVNDGQVSSTGTITVNLSDVDEGGNNAPSIEDQAFTIDENSSVSTAIGTVVASDTDGDALTFSITGGNTDDAFAVDGSSGALTVANSSPLDFETTPSFSLTVEVNDGQVSSTATITVNLSDVDESSNTAPTISDQSFSIPEDAPAETVLGSIIADDDDGDALTFSITDGNTGDAFALDPDNGQLTLAGGDILDFATTPEFMLTVSVSDGMDMSSAVITVTIEEVQVTGIDDEDVLSMQAFPNPTQDFIQIKNLDRNEVDHIELINISGKLVKTQLQNLEHISMSNLESGMYHILIYDKNGSVTTLRIIKN